MRREEISTRHNVSIRTSIRLDEEASRVRESRISSMRRDGSEPTSDASSLRLARTETVRGALMGRAEEIELFLASDETVLHLREAISSYRKVIRTECDS